MSRYYYHFSCLCTNSFVPKQILTVFGRTIHTNNYYEYGILKMTHDGQHQTGGGV